MTLFQQYGRHLIGITALMVVISVSSCSGITPDGNLRNNREEGPESGLFSGPEGEFVLVAPASGATDKKVEDTDGEKAIKIQQ